MVSTTHNKTDTAKNEARSLTNLSHHWKGNCKSGSTTKNLRKMYPSRMTEVKSGAWRMTRTKTRHQLRQHDRHNKRQAWLCSLKGKATCESLACPAPSQA